MCPSHTSPPALAMLWCGPLLTAHCCPAARQRRVPLTHQLAHPGQCSGVGPYSRPTAARRLASWVRPSHTSPPALAAHVELVALVREARHCCLIGVGVESLEGLALGEQLGGTSPQRGVVGASQ